MGGLTKNLLELGEEFIYVALRLEICLYYWSLLLYSGVPIFINIDLV